MEWIFLKYLLVPIVVALAMVGFALYAKVNALLRPGRLMIFVLLTAVALIVPALLGFMSYAFIPFGLFFVQAWFLFAGMAMVWVMRTGAYRSVGLGEILGIQFLAMLVAVILGGWGFYVLFDWLGKLSYSHWVAITVVWFFLPVFFVWARNAFVKLPPPYYEVWDLMHAAQFDETVWDSADYLRMMNISLKIKKSPSDQGYSSYPVLAPPEVPIAQWFMRCLKDQRIKFPNSPIEIESNGEAYQWIFYTTRFFIFNRPLSPMKSFEDYHIRNKSEIFVRRVQKSYQN